MKARKSNTILVDEKQGRYTLYSLQCFQLNTLNIPEAMDFAAGGLLTRVQLRYYRFY